MVVAALFSLVGESAAQSPIHPLDPLGKEEISAAVAVIRKAGKITDSSRFPLITLNEPPKSEVLAFKPGSPFRREAFAVVYERTSNKTFEAVVDLRAKSLISFKEIPDVQPQFMIEDVLLTQQIVQSDPQWQEAMRKRGITNFKDVQVDPWGAGFYGEGEGGPAVRIARGVSYYNAGTKNAYARPIEGVIAYVDLNNKRVFKLVDTGVVPIPKQTGELDQKSISKLRTAPKPLEIVQRDGPSFVLNGNEVSWQNWRFRYAMNPREGLVLYQVGYEDNGKLRSILYRASLSEMVVPYGDPKAGWFFRNAFDAGEYGIGKLALSLEPNTDFPANATLMPAVYAGDAGTPYDLPRAVAIYERDGGVLWKHADYSSLPFIHNESRRSRQLVLEWFANVGNYEYGFNWIFNQDGSMDVEVLLTGIMATRGVSPETDGSAHSESHGHVVADGVEAVHHQHFFNFRLDFDVDGTTNTVTEMNTVALPPGTGNPYNNSFTMRETMLGRERDAQRQLNLATARKWRVINRSVRNSLGQTVGYILFPGENSVPYASPESSVRKRAGFMNAHLWATPYDPSEIYAAGFYINQSKGGEGLPKWTSADRPLDDRDVVLWYTLGVTHIPRPEEWPVMVCHKAAFKLMPSGFFARNPALDVPKPE
jgi:primary-amine oxidase